MDSRRGRSPLRDKERKVGEWGGVAGCSSRQLLLVGDPGGIYRRAG